MWAITSYYNPIGFDSRLRNYRLFRERLALPLITVELSYDGVFRLADDDAEMLIRIGGRDVLWQKERLLNIALRSLPDDCDKVAWIDCDILFADDGWVDAAAEALDRHAVIQPFSTMRELPRGATPESTEPSAMLSEMTALAARLMREPMDDVLRRPAKPLRRHSTAWGFAWAARRDVIEPHGLYDACIVGGGDRAMICGAMGAFEHAVEPLQMNERWAEHYRAWAEPFYASVGGNVGCCDATAYHLWHGDFDNRRYRDRHEQLARFDFDPATDLTPAPSGCWAWRGNKPALHEWVRAYFEQRREDG
ncbi:MAG: hypothetical protein GC159_18045 [Phycisphaera sp.]|nr:hypothetical protein [Phycisphaera sp.]